MVGTSGADPVPVPDPGDPKIPDPKPDQIIFFILNIVKLLPDLDCQN